MDERNDQPYELHPGLIMKHAWEEEVGEYELDEEEDPTARWMAATQA